MELPRLSDKTKLVETTCRWQDVESGMWVAAKHVSNVATAEREVAALKLACKFDVPRVVQLKGDLQHPTNGRVLILE